MKCPRPYGNSRKRCNGQLVLVVSGKPDCFYCLNCLHTVIMCVPCKSEYRTDSVGVLRCVACGDRVLVADKSEPVRS